MPNWYRLEGHTPVPAPVGEAERLLTNAEERRVGHDIIGTVEVSTVFLCLDHNWGKSGRPLLFETMVFGGRFDKEQERYSTWNEAERGHQKWVKRVAGQGTRGKEEMI